MAEGEARPRLTAEGRRHPVTSLAPGDAPNEAAWAALPRGHGREPHAAARAGRRARPCCSRRPRVLVGRPAGAARGGAGGRAGPHARGRHRRDAGDGASSRRSTGQGNRAYLRFWNAALRWLVRDPALAPLQVEPDAPAVEPGAPVGLTISSRGPDFGPAAGRKVSAELVAEDGRPSRAARRSRARTARRGSSSCRPRRVRTRSWRTDEAGADDRHRGGGRARRRARRTPTPRRGPSCSRPSPRRPAAASRRCRTAGLPEPRARRSGGGRDRAAQGGADLGSMVDARRARGRARRGVGAPPALGLLVGRGLTSQTFLAAGGRRSRFVLDPRAANAPAETPALQASGAGRRRTAPPRR